MPYHVLKTFVAVAVVAAALAGSGYACSAGRRGPESTVKYYDPLP